MSNSEYQFKLTVAGTELLTGDKNSVGVIFGNLTGRNFMDIPDYNQYMAWMEHEYERALAGEIVMIGPDGAVLKRDTIAAH